MRNTLRWGSGSAGLRALAILLAVVGATRADAADVRGRVVTAGGEPVAGATVALVEPNRSTFTDDAGRFLFQSVSDGHYHLQFEHRRFGAGVREIDVSGGDADVELTLGVSRHQEKIVVSAGVRRGAYEVYQPIDVIEQSELAEKLRPTLGDTLSSEPGVRATSFAPGASRPIIRGQGGGRVRILEGGLDVGDASSTSPDHAVSTDPATAERIEILRGAATLLYGSSAVGGAVNIIDHRVPEHAPADPLSGSVAARYGTVADERAGTVDLDGGTESFAWHVDASERRTHDYEIPGRAVADDPASPFGTLPNSALEASTWTIGGSWIGSRGFLGASFRSFDTTYGIPAELEDEGDGPSPFAPPAVAAAIGDAGVAIDLDQRRFDVRGGLHRAFGPFLGVRFAAGSTDYEHVELEGGAVGTRFLNDTSDLRIELPHGRGNRASGVLGMQVGRRDFEAIGAEAFVPPSVTDSLALFAVEEIERGDLSYEFGVRYERQDVDAGVGRSRSFDGLSASAGLVYRWAGAWSLGGSLAQSVRLPSAEELFSDGPHLATLSYEVGDPDLDEETSFGLDLTLSRRAGRVTGQLSVFFNRFSDYIYEVATGDEEDGLPVFRFSQGDADFHGLEATAVISLIHAAAHDLDLELRADRVRADLTDGGGNLPRIPADRVGTSLHYRGARWFASAGATRTLDQDRVGPGEDPTPGYTMVDATIGYRRIGSGMLHEIMLRGSNLTDEEARPHTSRLKRFVPLPGRDVTAVYRLVF